MALSPEDMKELMKTKISAIANFPVTGQNAVIVDDRVLKALSEAIIEHFQAAAVVNVSVASVSGVQPGVGVSGPGSGTGTIL